MRTYSIHFSPTGGTKRVAELLHGPWAEVGTIDLCDPSADFGARSFGGEDVCFISVPSYGGRVPAVALERLGQMQGGGARAVLAVVYGNRAYEDTLLELKDAATAAGFRAVAAVSAVAEHSIMRQYGAGRPDETDNAQLCDFAAQLKAALEGGLAAEVGVPGDRPFREYKGVPLKPKADRKCTECGVCAAQCPVGAIAADRPGETDNARCISCMRCIGVCPTQARSVNSVMLFAAGAKLKEACRTRKENQLLLGKGV